MSDTTFYEIHYFCKLSIFFTEIQITFELIICKEVSLFACLIFPRKSDVQFSCLLFRQYSQVVKYSVSRFHGWRKRASEYKINCSSIQQSRQFNFQERKFLFLSLSIVLSLLMQQVRDRALW